MRMLLTICILNILGLGHSLQIGVSHPELIQDINLFRQRVNLPEWHQTRSIEPLGVLNSEGTALIIDTLGALVDSISLTFLGTANRLSSSTSDVYVMVYDNDVCIWSDYLPLPTSVEPHVRQINLLDEIRAPPADRVKIIDTFTYNGDYVALWRVRHMFDLVDEFVISEAVYTHSGLKKDKLFFNTPKNVALFAPYMSKITYIVVQDCPPSPEYWKGLMEGHMINWNKEYEGFWRENYQKLFCRFFIRPTSLMGKKTLIFVSDADEVLNIDTITELVRSEEELPDWDPLSLFAERNVVHPQLFNYNYNFNTVAMTAWAFPYLVSSERYEKLEDTLYVRVVHGDEAVFVPNGGWHLSYFTTYPGFTLKLTNIAHLSVPKGPSCEHIRDCIANSRDLFGRGEGEGVLLAPRAALAGAPSESVLLPPWWEEMQRQLVAMQRRSCECC